jgi:hypothetical protein
MDQKIYYLYYGAMILVITLIASIELVSARVRLLPSKMHQIKVFLLLAFVVGFIGLFPAGSGSDKQTYLYLFQNNFNITFDKDYGWIYYNYLIRSVVSSSTIYFIITAIIYIAGYYLFLKKNVPLHYLYYILLTTFGSLGFLSYGVNAIRAGIALSLFMIAISYSEKNIIFVTISLLAILIQKSIIIVLFAFLVTHFFTKYKWYIGLWFLFLLFSILNINIITDFIQNNFSVVDPRVVEYLGSKKNELYKSGFRYDFLLYSIIPIGIGFYYLNRMKFKNAVYLRLYNIYLLVNALWLLVIRIPFTDRFAYLSWFLFPILLLYPLFLIKDIKNRNRKIALIMISIVLTTFRL